MICKRIPILVSLSKISLASSDKTVKYNACTYTSVQNLVRDPKPFNCNFWFSKSIVLGTVTPLTENFYCAIPFENESVKKNIANKVIEFFIFVFELKNGLQIYIKAKVFQYCFFMLEKVLCIL